MSYRKHRRRHASDAEDIANVQIAELNIPVLIGSVIAGAALWFLCRFLYRLWADALPQTLVMGIVFTLLGLGVCVVVCLISRIGGTYQGNLFGRSDRSLPILAGGLAALFLLAALFQWLYSLDFKDRSADPTSYIFVIDDSGSMSGNDPADSRFDAIRTVMESMPADFPFMVYRFTDRAELMRDMAPLTAGDDFSFGESNGGTDIKAALQTVLFDLQSGLWDGGDNPRVLLLSDGQSNGTLRTLLKDYVAEGISVSTIGFGSPNDRLMQRIATRTGGVYIYVDDISLLPDAMRTASAAHVDRTLVSARSGMPGGVLYGILRIVFDFLLCFGIGLLAMTAYGRSDSMEITAFFAAVTALLGALLMELGTDLGLSEGLMWCFLWVLTAATVGTITRIRWGSGSGFSSAGHSVSFGEDSLSNTASRSCF